jgi:multidrug efflux pump subunit AcrB
VIAALKGCNFGHIIMGFDLSLISMMGIVALSGVVVNDSLIMTDYANRHRYDEGAFAAIHMAGIRRFRPIVLTTLTTFRGAGPYVAGNDTSGTALDPNGYIPWVRDRVCYCDYPCAGSLFLYGA